ncbi:ABC transporter permease [Pseudoalteromonas denitrificans]|uniref:Putative ABC transport system permease protein n=1 Tax=Pseudoalteromonas denitrificans DSM 6059 TaxID=1123010 RepID=A0A1I1QCJ0_9GAMM|nr:FtsX-like permease family protein [Pseudoalteromonas denitrificans]SFD15830.1 putative ABC transport system permease protein [Pseudoalteromonas denitrificans DSM 6059]
MSLFEMIIKNSFRKRIRFALTALSVAVAFFLLTLLAGIDHALNSNIGGNSQFRLMTSHKVSMTQSLPINYQKKIAKVEGVKAVTYASWFGGYFKNEKNQLAMSAVEHTSYFSLFDEYLISQPDLDSWKKNRIGIVIGQGVATEFGWKLGDKIPLSSSIWMNKQGSFSWEFVVAAIYQTKGASVDDKRIFFQHRYFDKSRAYGRNNASWFSTQITPEANLDLITNQVDAQFNNSSFATRTTSEQVFIKEQAQQFADMAMVIKVVLIAVFFTLLLIVCNTMVQAIRERLNEIAMMKALGFSSFNLIKQVYLESFFLLSSGAFIGCLLANITLSQVQKLMSNFLSGITIDPSYYFYVFCLVLFAAFICSFFPALTIKRLMISNTLGAKQ